jgi:outer membrane protein
MMNPHVGRRLALTLALVSLAMGSFAQRELSLVQAQTLGVENAYAMQRARIDVQVAKRDVKELLATGLPQVTASFDVNHFLDIPTQVAPAGAFGFPDYLMSFLWEVAQETGVSLNAPPAEPISEFQFGTTRTMTAGLNATQLIFSGSYLVGLKASQVFADAKALAVDATEVETRRLVAEAYATALAAEANVETLDRALTLVKSSEQELRELANEGLVESVDADQLQLTRQALEQQLSTGRLQAELTKQLLLFQCGLDVDEDVVLTDNLEGLTAVVVPEAVQASLNLSAIPALEEQRRYVALAELDVQNRRAEGLPQVAAFYANSAQAFRDPEFPVLADQNKWYPSQIVGLSVNMPIWTSFGGKQRVEKAKLQVLTAESGLEQMESAARLEHANAKATFLDAQATLSTAKAQRDLANRILTRIESGHKEGVRSSFELNTAQNQLLEAEGNLIGAQLAWLTAQQRLIASNPRP